MILLSSVSLELFISYLILFAIIFAYKTFQANKNFNPDLFIENSKNYNYEIVRDIYGVPHITGIKDQDTAFGFGFAQTEDPSPVSMVSTPKSVLEGSFATV